MTENTVEQETTEAGPVFPDEMAKMSFEMLSNLITERNTFVGKINAVKGDRLTLQEQLEENSTNPDAVKAREARDRAQAELDEAVMALHAAVQPEINSILADAEKSTSDIEEQVKESDAKIKPGVAYFKKMFGEDLAKHLPSLERLKGFSTRGAGSSGKRIRGYNVIVDLDGEVTEFENMAGAAKYLEVETSDLQGKFFEAAGNPEALKDAPDRVDFTVDYTETDEDGGTSQHTAKITAVRQAKDETPESDDATSE